MSQDTEKVAASEPTLSLENPFSVIPEDAVELGRYETTLKRGDRRRNMREGHTAWVRNCACAWVLRVPALCRRSPT